MGEPAPPSPARPTGELGAADARDARLMASASYWSRRFMRNLGIGLVALVVYLLAVTASHSTQTVFRLSMATGYASVALIAWAMLIGPWRVWRGRSAPVSTDLRRDVGIWG
ncbi:MAG TPA: hypothetical protein VFP90_06255, partial [Gemmatimonadaceae bacterium]|nr:hypothetical protein [Gemmatimonadaceae bacterium]